jgi:hypothetical protein
MLFDPKHEQHLGMLETQVRHAQALTSELVADVIANVCVRFAACETSAKLRVKRLIDAGAWTDATLALLELELPQWTLRRIIYEDGEWHCCLSRQPQLPLGFDEVSEASHEILPLAILIAFLQARHDVASSAAGVTAVPRVGSAPGHAMGCDNFA